MLNTLRAPVGNMRIFIRIPIRILHVVQSADPHNTRSLTFAVFFRLVHRFIYSLLDAVPPIHAESSHVATDKVPSM